MSLTPVAFEPQSVRINHNTQAQNSSDGRAHPDRYSLRSRAVFFPMLVGEFRGSLGRCEVGGFYAMTRLAAEGRCALLQPGRHQPIALAFSGAVGFDYGVVNAPMARTGLDFSADLGPLIPIIGLYLSTARQFRYLEDPEITPIEGPFPGSRSISRSEERLTIPLGLAIPLVRPNSPPYANGPPPRVALVLGASPWFSLHSGACSSGDCSDVTWDAEHGIVFSLGVDVR